MYIILFITPIKQILNSIFILIEKIIFRIVAHRFINFFVTTERQTPRLHNPQEAQRLRHGVTGRTKRNAF